MMTFLKLCFLLLSIGSSWAFQPIIINAGETGRQDLHPSCAYGINYGCKNISTAHDCEIVKTCISSVWNDFKLPEDRDDICQICKEMVKEARDQLLSNETQEEIKEVFDGSCNLIPIKIIAEECCKVADQFIPELVETLASEMNPQMVCATAGLCNSERIDKMLKEREEKMPRSDCDKCVGYAKDLQRYIKKSPKSILLEKALVACGHLNSFSTGCRAKVIDNFNAIHKYLETTLKNVNEGCAFFGFCQQNELTYDLGKNEDDPECEFCEKMVQHWIDALTSGTTEEEFKQILEAVCDRLGSYKDECNMLVDDYFEDLYNLLVNQVKPAEVCQMFGLCERKKVHYKANVWALIPPGAEEKVKMILADEAVGRDEAAAVSAKNSKLPSVKLQKSEFAELTPAKKPSLPRIPLTKSNKVAPLPLLNAQNAPLPLQRFSLNSIVYDATKTSCVMCEYVMHEVQNMLTKESTEEEIKKSLDKVCSIMPTTLAKECDQFVNQYTDLVVALLVQEIDPSKVCTYLQLCPEKVTKKLTRAPDAECELCEFVIHLLDEYLEDDATEETIRDTLKEVCGYMPKSVVKQCQEFVNEYEPMIVEALAAALTPDETCVELNMCKPRSLSNDEMHHESPTMTEWKKEQVEVLPVKQGVVMESPGCVMCEFAMTQIASMLNDKSTDEEIIAAVENVCDYLPKTVKSDCKAFVETYGQAVIDVLKDETKDPKEACSLIGLCAAAKGVKHLKLNRCEGCEMVVSYLDRILKEDKTEEHITEALEKVCNIVPPGYNKQCKKIVHVYGAYLVGLMEELKDEHEVCAAVNLCLKDKPLLGGDKCTWGPSYWCISPFHAKSCKATTHCKEKVWKKQ